MMDHLQAMHYFFPQKLLSKKKNPLSSRFLKNFKIIYLRVWPDLPKDKKSVDYLQQNLTCKESCWNLPLENEYTYLCSEL